MGKSSSTKVEAALASLTEQLNKFKRDEDHLGLEMKQQKKELIPLVQAADKKPSKKVDKSTSYSSDSDVKHKTKKGLAKKVKDDTSSEYYSLDEEPDLSMAESSSYEDESSSDEERYESQEEGSSSPEDDYSSDEMIQMYEEKRKLLLKQVAAEDEKTRMFTKLDRKNEAIRSFKKKQLLEEQVKEIGNHITSRILEISAIKSFEMRKLFLEALNLGIYAHKSISEGKLISNESALSHWKRLRIYERVANQFRNLQRLIHEKGVMVKDIKRLKKLKIGGSEFCKRRRQRVCLFVCACSC